MLQQPFDAKNTHLTDDQLAMLQVSLITFTVFSYEFGFTMWRKIVFFKFMIGYIFNLLGKEKLIISLSEWIE